MTPDDISLAHALADAAGDHHVHAVDDDLLGGGRDRLDLEHQIAVGIGCRAGLGIGQPHRLLVERREVDDVGKTVARKFECCTEDELAGFDAHGVFVELPGERQFGVILQPERNIVTVLIEGFQESIHQFVKNFCMLLAFDFARIDASQDWQIGRAHV